MKTRFKIYIILASILCWVNFSCTEDAIVKETSSLRSSSLLSAEVVTIKLEQAGTLAEKIGDKKGTVENLVLSGPFNAVDVRCIREMPYLKYLDMESVDIKGGNETYVSQGTNRLEENTIGKAMFYGLNSLISVKLPKNIIKIGSEAFKNPTESNLEMVTIPNSVKTIDESAFAECVNLKNILLPDGLISIGGLAFRRCHSLEQIVVPNSVKEIGSYVFEQCIKLKVATIPAYLVSMDNIFLFNSCSFLSEIKIEGTYTSIGANFFQGVGLNSFTIPVGVREIGNGAFQNTKITSISIPNTVKSIGSAAFRGSLLTSIVIPDNVTSLGSYALCDCLSLSSVTLSSNLSILEECLLVNACLKNIVIPNSVTTIGYRALDNTGLESLTIPSSVINIANSAGFNKLPNLTSLIWDSPSNCDNESVLRIPSNCLVYVSSNAAMPTSWKNVIVKGTAESISLVEGVAYNCPKDFYAKKITFKKKFSMKTGNGEAAGWETIVLPFEATTIKDNTGAILVPFDSNVNNAKNFWLRELTGEGFKDVKTIEANKPYIIAMPNNSNYDSKYNIAGDIIFEAQNITVKATPDELNSTSGPSFSMSPVYKTLPRANQIYVINKEQEFEGAKPGSVFVRNLRDLKPFEAYISPSGATPSSLRMIRIDGPVRTKSASDDSLKNKM